MLRVGGGKVSFGEFEPTSVVGGAWQYAHINCGFKPKKLFVYILNNGEYTSGGGIQMYDEDISTTHIFMRLNGTYDKTQPLTPSGDYMNDIISIDDDGFTMGRQNYVTTYKWYYVAIG